MRSLILLMLASLSALAQTATFNSVRLTGPVNATNNAITAQYATDRIGADAPLNPTLSGQTGVPTVSPIASTSTFSGWGQQVTATNNWNMVEFYMSPFNASAVPTSIRVRVRQIPASPNDTNNPSTFTVLETVNQAVTLYPPTFNRVSVRFATTFSSTNNLWIEYEANGREGGRLGNVTATNLIANPPGRWYTTATNLSGTWTKASSSTAFFARYLLAGSSIRLDTTASALTAGLPIPSRYNATINLPDTLWALEGRQMNLYFQNVVWGYDGLGGVNVTASSSVGNQFGAWGGYWRYAPGATTATNSLTLNASTPDGTILASRTVTVLTRPLAYPSTPVSRRVHCIGDSTFAQSGNVTLAELVNLFSGDSNYTMTLVGSNTGNATDSTSTSRAVACDAITGFSTTQMVSDSTSPWTTIGGTGRNGSPFVFGGVFDYGQFLTARSITMSSGDVVIIHMGINDIFGAFAPEGADTISATAAANIETMITSIQSAVPGVRVGVCVTIPPNGNEEAWGVDYTTASPPWRLYRRNRNVLAQRIVNQFNGRTASGIFCIAYSAHLDTVNNFGTSSTAINARNSATYARPAASSAVHPGANGYYQMADTLRSFLKGIE